jgi:hypothetical protein
MMKDMVGNPESFGGDLRDALSVPVKTGSIPLTARPSELVGKPLSHLRYIANWRGISDLLALAWRRRAKSYVFIKPTQGMDAFDTIAATMWYFLQKGDKRAAVFGTFWDWSLSQYVINTLWNNEHFGHAMTYIGKTTINGVKYLVVEQNYGPTAGRNGQHLFSREVVNASENIFGVGTFTSYTPDEIRTMVDNGYKADKNVLLSTMIALYKFLLDMRKKLTNNIYGIFHR